MGGGLPIRLLNLRKSVSGRLFMRLLSSYLAVTLLSLTVLGVLFAYMMHRYFFRVEGWEVSARADRAISILREPLGDMDLEKLQQRTETLAYSYSVRLWVIDEGGTALASSGGGQEASGLDLDEVEMMHVLEGNILTKQIAGPKQNSLLHVKPVITSPGGQESDDEIMGAVALESPLGRTVNTLAQVARLGFWAAIPALALAATVGFSLSRRISRPVEEMSRVARGISRGNLEKRVSRQWGHEMDQLAETFNQALEQIVSTMEERERLERLRKEFLSNTAHEFKAPLTTLRGFLELMLDRDLDEGERRRYMELMLEDTLHLNRLVQDLIDLSSLESGDVRFEMTSLAPGRLVARVIEHFESQAREDGVELIGEVSSSLPCVRGDSSRLHQVLTNLIRNALQHTPPGGQVLVRAAMREGDSDSVWFTVSDTGPGVPESERDLIWERFHKIDSARSRQESGTGLGLAIVKEIVDRHDGTVGVVDGESGGAEFYFSVPLAREIANGRSDPSGSLGDGQRG